MKVKLMERAIELALMGKGNTSPNPMVGSVIFNKGKIVGEGYHKKAGQAHAEINALKEAGSNAMGASMYVTLEPCCHQGKTPPCTQAIIKSGINKVVIGITDPNPIVSGKGIKELRDNGIQVFVGLLEKEICKMNESYIKYITTGLPFIIMKVGMSLDGKIATYKKESKWITSEQSRKIVHLIRDEVDAVMVGIGTVLEDNPTLSIKFNKKKKGPARVIVDSTLKIPLNANILEEVTNRRTLILTTEHADRGKIKELEDKGVTVIITPEINKRVDLKKGALALGKQGITSMMLEGGGDLNFSALQDGILDKVLFFIAPRIIGGQAAISSIGGSGINALKDSFTVKDIVISRVGSDILVEGYLPVKWKKNTD